LSLEAVVVVVLTEVAEEEALVELFTTLLIPLPLELITSLLVMAESLELVTMQILPTIPLHMVALVEIVILIKSMLLVVVAEMKASTTSPFIRMVDQVVAAEISGQLLEQEMFLVA
jgi:hypothetical protein